MSPGSETARTRDFPTHSSGGSVRPEPFEHVWSRPVRYRHAGEQGRNESRGERPTNVRAHPKNGTWSAELERTARIEAPRCGSFGSARVAKGDGATVRTGTKVATGG